MTTTGKILSGFILGTAVGAAIGVLYAPKKGYKTRKLIADKANDMKHSAEKTYHQAKEMLGLEKTKDRAMAETTNKA